MSTDRESLRLTARGDWPRCLYNTELFCGEPETRQVQAGPSDQELVRRGWHIVDMCDCPSCPLRVAISATMRSLAAPLGEGER